MRSLRDSADLGHIINYYENDLGLIPAPISAAGRAMPAALLGYFEMRQFVWGETDDQPTLPKKYVNLIFALLDLSSQNELGAVNHARAALQAGLDWHELMQGIVQVWIVFGFASTWGTVGYKVVQSLEAEGFAPQE
jgi:alkylhydroperoxidase/carboxymuconolactone decarboxylase family protein YurZ